MVADDVWGARGEETGGTAVLESSARWSEEGAGGNRPQVSSSTGCEFHSIDCWLHAGHLLESNTLQQVEVVQLAFSNHLPA